MESVRLEPFAHLSSLSVNCTDECLNPGSKPGLRKIPLKDSGCFEKKLGGFKLARLGKVSAIHIFFF